MISWPSRSSPTAPPQPVGTPSVAATRATFQQAPPATLCQVASPVRTKSVSASPKTTKAGQGRIAHGPAQASGAAAGTAAGADRRPSMPAFTSSP